MSRTHQDVPYGEGHIWVFGYGSLMWHPGFAFAVMQTAVLAGYRRDMCFLSIHYRGTPENPGLVCGLVGVPESTLSCKGGAFRIHKGDVVKVVSYLDERELITDIYRPTHSRIRLENGREVTARTYLSDTKHDQFVGSWPDEKKAAAIAVGVGSGGSSLEYLENIVNHLNDRGIADEYLIDLLNRARHCKAG